MRVLYYSGHPDIPSSGDAGYATHMRGMIHGLEANGATVHTLIAGDGESIKRPQGAQETSGETTVKAGVRRVLPGSMWNVLRDLRLIKADRSFGAQLGEKLANGGYDLIYERHAHLHRLAACVARRSGVFHILEVNSPPDERAVLGGISPLDFLGRRFARETVRSSDVTVFVSSALRDAYEELIDEEIRHALIVPNAVNSTTIAAFRERPPSPHNNDQVTIGFVGSLLRWHGVDMLMEAFAEVHMSRPNTRLEIVGDGELRANLEADARSLNLGEAITFTGSLPHEQALERVASFDIGVAVNSNRYGSPLKLFEYAALGCAIVAPDVAPAHEVLLDGDEALFVSPNKTDIVTTLIRLVDDADLRRRLGAAARSRIVAEHTWDRAAARVLEATAYERALRD